MKRTNISKLLAALFIGGILTTGCNDTKLEDPETPEHPQGYVSLDFSLIQGTRATNTVTGETDNEDAINTLDLFFYDENANEDTDAAKYAMHDSSPTDDVQVSVKKLTDAFGETVTKCKVIAVVNCDATKSLTASGKYPAIKALKEIQLSAKNTKDNGIRDFRSAEVPEDFVMTNLAQPTVIEWKEEGGLKDLYTINLKRVAAKIRVALNVVESIEQDGATWTAKTDNMRLFISNGVTKGQLDGSHITLTEDDYYSISTSGSSGAESDYALARIITKPTTQDKGASGAPETDKTDFPCYNEIPYYTYPNEWTESMTETTQTTLTIVVPWTKKVGNTETYHPTYYTIPVNNETTIESNKYYYLRIHIGMIGSLTPELPMPVDMTCDIADWIESETHANIRPVHYLIFNQKEYVMNNTNSITIPFISTDDCTVSFSGQFYAYNGNKGTKITKYFDDSMTRGKGTFYDYSIDNYNRTLTFTHDFFSYWSVTSNNNNKVTSVTKSDTENSDYHRLFSPFEIDLTVSHIKDPNYSADVHLTIYPAIYVTIEEMPNDSRNENYGWIYLNGSMPNNTGGLSDYGASIGNRDVGSLTILTVTQLNDEEKKKWVIDDPRSYYINNAMDNGSMESDTKDNTSSWDNFISSGTIWKDYTDVSNVDWSEGTWMASQDHLGRKLKYYYPAAEQSDKANIIAPKIIMASYHSYCGQVNRETARRRCAAFQQYGYPAGRWRLPTLAEIGILKLMQRYQITQNIFFTDNSNNTDGYGTNWCNMGATGNGITFGPNASGSYVRCVYDLWYWEQQDANGRSTARMPEDQNKEKWKTFTWGDRPKQNPLVNRPNDSTEGQTRAAGGNGFTMQDFMQKNAPGNYAVIRDGENVRMEKLETAE